MHFYDPAQAIQWDKRMYEIIMFIDLNTLFSPN